MNRQKGFLVLMVFLAHIAFSPAQTRTDINVMPANGTMLIGVDYYPEHWPEERWETDLKLMKEAGFNVVRVAEFSWVFLEPSEGQFDFSWLDEFLALANKYQISAILGTPTAVMPAWVARKYPDALATKKDGQKMVWGDRKNNCFSDGTYRLLSERIVRAMAEHYKNTPNVIGWQTDNEFGAPVCYCHTCLSSFQDWLKAKYGTLDSLNKAWGTYFWGHKLQSWQEIQIPDCIPEGGDWSPTGNPGACLDWHRFNSWLNVRFQHDQVKILREVCPPRQFITHNMMGLAPAVDYYNLGKDLDFASWDNYPIWWAPDYSYNAAMAADLMRGIKQKNFLIMEQTAGPSGWGTFYRDPLPGEIREVAYQQLAHGADGQIWFRWRTCTAGREQYWHGLLGHDGKPLRRYNEAKQVAAEYRKIERTLRGTTVKAEVAILYDYDCIWSLTGQPGYPGNTVTDDIARFYNALFRAGINTDIISPKADISKYKLVIAPDLIVLPDSLAYRLDAYVRSGGVLLTDCRTGVKNETNLAYERTLPGLLSPVLGIEIEEYGTITPDFSYRIVSNKLFRDTLTAVKYADWITSKGADIVAGYDHWHMKSFAAVTRNKYGKGYGWYVGTIGKEEKFYDSVLSAVLEDAGIKKALELPSGVEASFRENRDHKILFLINHTEMPQTVMIPAGKKDLLNDKLINGSVELGIFGVAVIQW